MPKTLWCINESYPVLSNDYIHQFTHLGQTFSTGLQAYVFAQNRFNASLMSKSENDENENCILATCYGYDLHSISRKIITADEWSASKLNIMKAIVHSRLSQIPSMQDNLLQTRNRTLVYDDEHCAYYGVKCNARIIRWTLFKDLPGQNQLSLIYADILEKN